MGAFPVRWHKDAKDGESAYLNTITLRGTSKSDTANPVGTATIRVNGETTSYVTSMLERRGINMWLIKRDTLEVMGDASYTSTSPANGSVFHDNLSGINDNYFIAIVSWGQFCMPEDVALELNDFGGDFTGKMPFGRRAFAFIGYRGLARGRALQVINEGSGLTAEISTTVIDGMIQPGPKDGEDGKDGKTYYTWIKYADSVGEQGYPASEKEIYDTPKPTTRYIGISYNNDSATEGTSPTSYTWTKIKGEDGMDGTSFKVRGTCEEVYNYEAFHEEAEKVVGKIYLLEDADMEDYNAMAVKWTDSGEEDLKAVDGDAFVKESNKVLFVKDRNVWRDLGTIQGPKGDRGDDGQDAVSYRLESSVKAIHLNNDGSPQITSFTLTAYMFKGSVPMKFDETYEVGAGIFHDNSSTPVRKSYKLSADKSSVEISLTTPYGTQLNNINKVVCYLSHAGVAIDNFDILPIKAGAAGVSYIPNMRGNWSEAETYKWDDVSRDMVTYTEGGVTKLYAVKRPGTTIDAGTKLTSDLWQVSDGNYQIVFSNFVFADNAVIGGFTMSEGLFESVAKNGNVSYLKINGNDATITLKNGKAGLEMGLDDNKMPYLRGTNTDGEVIWSLGQKPVVNFNADVIMTIQSITSKFTMSGSTCVYSAKVVVAIRNNTNSQTTFTADVANGISVLVFNPITSSTNRYGQMTCSNSLTLAVGAVGTMEFHYNYRRSNSIIPVEGTEIVAKVSYVSDLKDVAYGTLVEV